MSAPAPSTNAGRPCVSDHLHPNEQQPCERSPMTDRSSLDISRRSPWSCCHPLRLRSGRRGGDRRPRRWGRQGRAVGGGSPPTDLTRRLGSRHVAIAFGTGASSTHTRPRAESMNEGTSPANATLPWSSTSTWSHTAPTSSVWWVASSTVPWRPRSDSVARNTARCSGSRPVVGSSRISRSGSPISAWANANRRRWPPESLRILIVGRSASCTASKHATDLVVSCCLVVPLLEHRDVFEEPERRHPRRELDLLGQEAEPATNLGPLGERSRSARWPSTSTHPASGAAAVDKQRQQCCLAGAVRPEQRSDAGADLQRDVVERDGIAIPAGDVLELDGDVHRMGLSSDQRAGTAEDDAVGESNTAPAASGDERAMRTASPAWTPRQERVVCARWRRARARLADIATAGLTGSVQVAATSTIVVHAALGSSHATAIHASSRDDRPECDRGRYGGGDVQYAGSPQQQPCRRVRRCDLERRSRAGRSEAVGRSHSQRRQQRREQHEPEPRRVVHAERRRESCQREHQRGRDRPLQALPADLTRPSPCPRSATPIATEPPRRYGPPSAARPRVCTAIPQPLERQRADRTAGEASQVSPACPATHDVGLDRCSLEQPRAPERRTPRSARSSTCHELIADLPTRTTVVPSDVAQLGLRLADPPLHRALGETEHVAPPPERSDRRRPSPAPPPAAPGTTWHSASPTSPNPTCSTGRRPCPERA